MSKQNDRMTSPGVFIDPNAKPLAPVVLPLLIVKVQVPLNNLSGDYLIYDQHRTFELMVPPSSELQHRMRGEAKRYFYARLTERMELLLDDDAPGQPW